jgi:PAS domain S-box-containing protein
VGGDDEEKRLRSVAIQNASSILLARQSAERELIAAKEALSESNERLQLALDAAHLGDWNWDAATDRLTLGQRAARIFGLPAGIPVPRARMLELLPPEDAERVGKALHHALAERTDYGIEYRVNRPAGGQYWIASSGRGRYAEDGAVIGITGVMQNITERKQADGILRDSEERYRTLFELGPVAVYSIDTTGVIQNFNRKAAELWGREPALGDTDERFCGSFRLFRPDGSFMPHAQCPMAEVVSGKRSEARDAEVLIERPDGSRVTVVVNICPLKNQRGEITGAINCFYDISERKRAETVAARLAAIVDSSDDAVVGKDLRGIVTNWNAGAEKIFGYPAAEIVGQSITLLIPPQRQVEEETILGQIARGESVRHFETVRRRKDGSTVDVSITVSAIKDAAGKIIGASKVARDITERKRLDQVLQEKNAELESARSVAEKANLAKSDFLSSMSHELRTPLTAILGFTQLMESGSPPPTPSQKRSIDQILKAGWYLLELINEILDLALIESGKLSLSLEPIALTEVVRECQAMIEPQAQKHDIRMTFPQFEVPYFVKADRTRVKQVLINLLSNAIKYNRVGGAVDVDYTASTAERIRICIKDSGEGLTPDKLTQLFQPFNRLGKEAGIEEGTGIGLMVSKRLVELMGGVIGVESTVGKGSVFWIELNLTAEPQPAAGAGEPTAVAQAQVHADGRLRTLLYVEDNPANLMLVEDLIARRPDIRLLTARDGIRGVEIARASRPDVILMDINLPGISGIQALRILAEDRATAHIPVVALSANAMPRDIERGLEAGFFRYLTKPIKVNEFMDTLNVALKFAKTQAARTNKEEKA